MKKIVFIMILLLAIFPLVIANTPIACHQCKIENGESSPTCSYVCSDDKSGSSSTVTNPMDFNIVEIIWIIAGLLVIIYYGRRLIPRHHRRRRR